MGIIRRLGLETARRTRSLRRDRSGVAVIEFAYILPIVLMLSLTGAEVANYITVRMQISQLALHIADNAARIGSGSQLAAKTITEADINDLFIGAQLQSGTVDLKRNGRVILSDLEYYNNGNDKVKIKWQRCYGDKTSHASSYGTAGGGPVNGVGPPGRQVDADSTAPTMFVEVYYEYQPLIAGKYAPNLSFTEVASMMVRDRRDTTGGDNGVYPVNGVTASSC